MNGLLRPAADWELAMMLSELAQKATPVEILGSGSKRGIGRPVQASVGLSTLAFKGITLYEPTELVMSARAGTPLSLVESELARRGQMLAFEPVDTAAALGVSTAEATIGGVFLTNASGPRRVAVGAARDHLIGIKGVNGRGETFKSGGRVMKNVTGYDITRGVAGSWGTLAVVTEVTFKVVPRPEDTLTLVFFGLPDDIGVELLTAAMGTPYEVSGAVHLQQGVAGRLGYEALRMQGKSVTAIRIENFTASIAYRRDRLKDQLKAYGRAHELSLDNSLSFWREITTLSVMPVRAEPLWRISAAPKAGPEIVRAIGRYMAVQAFYDWSGGLVWLEVPPTADAGASDIRRVVAAQGGHATLIRAAPAVRSAVDVFQPPNPGVERLSRGLKAVFDPAGILNPGRMHATL